MDEHSTYTEIDIPAYNQRRADADFEHILLDVREPEEYAMGHIPGAVPLPLGELEARVAEVPTDKPVVVVCGHGIRSTFGAKLLIEAGHPAVYNLLGGTAEWEMRRLPLDY